MHLVERRNQILAALTEKGSVQVAHLANKFGISEVTIRNDLRELETQGLLIRFHGGATNQINNWALTGKPNGNNDSLNEIKLEDRTLLSADAKTRIANAAARLVSTGNSVIIDSGSTTLKIAQQLADAADLIVVTNNLPAAEVLSINQHITLVLCGGTFRHKTRSFHGMHAESVLKGIVADYLFIGADGIDIEKGITTFNEGYAISKVMARAAKKVVAVLDSTKFGRIGFNPVLPISDIDVLITDDGINRETVMLLENRNIDVIIV